MFVAEKVASALRCESGDALGDGISDFLTSLAAEVRVPHGQSVVVKGTNKKGGVEEYKRRGMSGFCSPGAEASFVPHKSSRHGGQRLSHRHVDDGNNWSRKFSGLMKSIACFCTKAFFRPG